MQATQYIQAKLESIKTSDILFIDKRNLEESIIHRILSKKFRKYAVDDEFSKHLRVVIKNAIEKNVPISFTWVFGGYKLWRLPTSPKVDWAELFSLIYFASWLAPICKAYKPGVWFDFYSDDAIVSKMNNIPKRDLGLYIESFRNLLVFMKTYAPDNFRFTLNRVIDKYDNERQFEDELSQKILELREKYLGQSLKLTKEQINMITLNVKTNKSQLADPKWKERVQLIHDSYAQSSKRRPYYRNEQKIMVVNTPLPCTIAVGTTKTSVVKFWVGIGVLEKRDKSFIERILSPQQIDRSIFNTKSIAIKNLPGKNFETINILR